MIPIKKGMRVKNHDGAKGIVVNILNIPWGFPIEVMITEPHPLYELSEIAEFRREDIKPIFTVRGDVSIN
jgi:hypothetical protein